MEAKRIVNVEIIITRKELTDMLRRKKILRSDETITFLKIKEGELLVSATSQEKKPTPQKKSNQKIQKGDIPVDLLNSSLVDLGLNTATYNAVSRTKATTLEELLRFPKTDLMKYKGFGPKGYTNLVAAIKVLQKKHNFTKFDLVPGILSDDSNK